MLRREGDDVACIILEPVQGEGGDNHFRPEFWQALRRLANEHEVSITFLILFWYSTDIPYLKYF